MACRLLSTPCTEVHSACLNGLSCLGVYLGNLGPAVWKAVLSSVGCLSSVAARTLQRLWVTQPCELGSMQQDNP